MAKVKKARLASAPKAKPVMITCAGCGYEFGYIPTGFRVRIVSNEWGQCLTHTVHREIVHGKAR